MQIFVTLSILLPCLGQLYKTCDSHRDCGTVGQVAHSSWLRTATPVLPSQLPVIVPAAADDGPSIRVLPLVWEALKDFLAFGFVLASPQQFQPFGEGARNICI